MRHKKEIRKGEKRIQPIINFALYGTLRRFSLIVIGCESEMEKKKGRRVIKARRIIAAQQDDFLAG